MSGASDPSAQPLSAGTLAACVIGMKAGDVREGVKVEQSDGRRRCDRSRAEELQGGHEEEEEEEQSAASIGAGVDGGGSDQGQVSTDGPSSSIPFPTGSRPLTPTEHRSSTSPTHQPPLNSSTSQAPPSLPFTPAPTRSIRDRISSPPGQIFAPSVFDLASFSAQLDMLSSFQLSPIPPSSPTTPMGPPFSSLLLPHFADEDVSPTSSPAKLFHPDDQVENDTSPRPSKDRDSLLSMATTTSGLFTFPNSPVGSTRVRGKGSLEFGHDEDLIDFADISTPLLRSPTSQAELSRSLSLPTPIPSLPLIATAPATGSPNPTPHSFTPPIPPSSPTPPSAHSHASSPSTALSDTDVSDTFSEVGEEDEEDEDLEEEEEEEEDPDTHPLYTLLSSSTHPALRAFWDASTLILVPPRRSLPSLAPLLPPVLAQDSPASTAHTAGTGFEFVRGGKGVGGELVGRDGMKDRDAASEAEREKEELVRYIGLHAFRPEIEKTSGDAWRSVGRAKLSESHSQRREAWLRVDLELSRGLIHVGWAGTSSPPPPSHATPRPTDHLDRSISTNSSLEETSVPELLLSTRAGLIANDMANDFRRGSLDSDVSSTMPPTPPALTALSFPPPGTALNLKLSETVNAAIPFPVQLPTATSTPQLPQPLASKATRSLQMVSETTIYRRAKQLIPPTSAPPVVVAVKPASKSAFRTPKWLRRGGSGSTASSSSSTTMLKKTAFENAGPVLERVRVVAVDGQLVEGWPNVTAGPASNLKRRQKGIPSEERRGPSLETRRTSSIGGLGRTSREPSLVDLGVPVGMSRRRAGRTDSIASTRSARSAGSGWQQAGGNLIGSKRDFLEDLCFLTTPSQQLSALTPSFQKCVTNIHHLVSDFESSFDYIKGFEVYTVQRIRKRIFDPVFSELVSDLRSVDGGSSFMAEERVNLPLLLENVILGFVHWKLYTHSILPDFVNENSTINSILTLYRAQNVTLDDFGISIDGLGADDLQGAVALLSHFTSSSSSLPTAELTVTLDVSSTIVESLVLAKTPLSGLSSMRSVIEEIVATVGRVHSSSRVAPDDLIPLLAWVMVQSEVTNLESTLFYVKTFRLNESMSPEFEWSLVTFHASIAFLVSDPLQAVAETPLPAPSSATSFPFPPTSPQRFAADLPSFRARRASVHGTLQSANPSSPRSFLATGLPRLQTQGMGYTMGGANSAISPVLERRHSKSSFHHRPSDASTRPTLSSSLSGVASRAGPPLASSDMRRSESEGSPTVSRSSGDLWLRSGAGGDADPSVELIDAQALVTSQADYQSWWAWGKERLDGASGVPATTAMSQLERVRARRHSASEHVLHRADNSGLSTRLLATSQSRPPSVISLRSLASLDADNSSFSSPPLSKRASARRSTQSLMRRDLAASDLFAAPLAPQLDASSVMSFPASASISTESLALSRYNTFESLQHSVIAS